MIFQFLSGLTSLLNWREPWFKLGQYNYYMIVCRTTEGEYSSATIMPTKNDIFDN
jgi:hypothetical protein